MCSDIVVKDGQSVVHTHRMTSVTCLILHMKEKRYSIEKIF